jgi:hypothetical protein
MIRRSAVLGLLALVPLARSSAAQVPLYPPVALPYDPAAKIDGTVEDLARDAAGRILYCTAEGQVGRIVPGGVWSVLATQASGPFPNELRAVAETPAGDVAVLDKEGHVRVLFGASTPASLVYSDLHMIADATDLIVDGRGSYLIASATPSNGQRAMNWVAADGVNWSYYLVKHMPAQLAHDPLTGGILIADTTDGGKLQLVRAGSETHQTNLLDGTTQPGLTLAQSDGDLTAEADGDVYWIAGGKVYKHTRSTSTTTLFASGYKQLRGAVIAASSGWAPSATGWSLYLAEGDHPTRLREIANVDAPGGVIAADQGPVPGRGLPVNVNFGFQVFELTADNQGRLLVGGTLFGPSQFIKRITLTGTPSITTLATSANGLIAPVEGLCVAPDDSIYALGRTGEIQWISEGPLIVTTIFSDPTNTITAGKDLALDVNGTLYIASREGFGFGKVSAVTGGTASLLTATQDSRGLAANPAGGMFVSQWHNTGFNGTVDLLHFAGNTLETLPGFSGMNYTNDFVWGDCDICVDANGAVYTISEDDWSLVRYEPGLQGFVRVGSGYLNHPSGLAIAPSTATSGSTSGWSLYVSEFDNLWEIPSVAAPAATLVDASLGLVAGRRPAASPHPRFGRPRALAVGPWGEGVLVGTAGGWVLELDRATGELRPLAGPEQGLRGELVALVAEEHGPRILALNRAGELFELSDAAVRALPLDPRLVAAPIARALAAPRRMLHARDPVTGASEWLLLDGWVVWRLGN